MYFDGNNAKSKHAASLGTYQSSQTIRSMLTEERTTQLQICVLIQKRRGNWALLVEIAGQFYERQCLSDELEQRDWQNISTTSISRQWNKDSNTLHVNAPGLWQNNNNTTTQYYL